MLTVVPMGTTNKTAIEYTQKEMREEFKHNTTKINYTRNKTTIQELRNIKSYKEYRKNSTISEVFPCH